jgi:DNA-binding HxlR family transcriptional regulator
MQLRKLTNARRTEEKRRFDDACGLAHAMELLGERWAMLVLRELAYGPRRFSDLKNDLQGISANVLTQRLTELEARGQNEAAAARCRAGL